VTPCWYLLMNSSSLHSTHPSEIIGRQRITQMRKRTAVSITPLLYTVFVACPVNRPVLVTGILFRRVKLSWHGIDHVPPSTLRG
jgi:hypothetical protein